VKRTILFSLAVLCAVGALPQRAEAGGLFLTDRGTRPLGRGFAFVAGADDPQSIWYNPAGLGFSGQQLLLDATMTFLRADFTRIDSGGNVLPTVSVDAAKLPIPMLAYSHPLREDLVLGFGVFAPNASLLRWPRGVRADGGTCDGTGEPTADCEAAPQRYSLYSLEGSAFVNVTAALAYKPIPELSIGAGVQLLLGRFVGETAISACDGFICTQAENPEYDGLARFDLNPIVHPGFTLGATYDAGMVRVGASMVWWPSAVSGDAKLNVRLPSAPLFDGARVEGDTARLELDLPLMVRAGVEVRPVRQVRVEAAFVWEHWSTQDGAHIQPNDIWIRDAVAIGDYQVGDIDIPRNMNDVYSLRLGAEIDAVEDLLTVSVGLNYENSSFDDAYLSPLTLDSRKVVVALGASVQVIEGLFLDVSYGHVFMADPQVRNSQVPQPNPIRPPRSTDVPAPAGGAAFVGNGDYNMEADIVGVGLRWQVDPAAPASDGAEAEPEPTPGADPEPTEEERPWHQGPADPSGADDQPEASGDAPSDEEEADPDSPWYRP
jgi:long-chain fatty acid transport protein